MKSECNNRPLVTLLIPAYNEPELLERALNSIVQQTYRPLEVIVADDCSPRNLGGIVRRYSNYPDIRMVYLKNETNLRLYWNIKHARQFARGKIMSYFQHDDYYIDKDFLKKAVDIFQSRPDCKLYVSNALNEDNQEKVFSTKLSVEEFYNGNDFLKYNLWNDFHPSYSSVVFDNDYITEKGYDGFFFDRTSYDKYNILPDELLLAAVLAAEDSLVYVSTSLTSVRGFSPRSLSRSVYWNSMGSYCVFISRYGIYNYFKSNRKYFQAIIQAIMIVRSWPMPSFNYDLIKIAGPKVDLIFFMIVSNTHYRLRRILAKMMKGFRESS